MVPGSNPGAGTKIEFKVGSERSTAPTAYCQCIAKPQNTPGGLGRREEARRRFRRAGELAEQRFFQTDALVSGVGCCTNDVRDARPCERTGHEGLDSDAADDLDAGVFAAS